MSFSRDTVPCCFKTATIVLYEQINNDILTYLTKNKILMILLS